MKQGAAAKGSISKEDAARICVEALSVIPPTGLIFEVDNIICFSRKKMFYLCCFQYKEAFVTDEASISVKVTNGEEVVTDWEGQLMKVMQRQSEKK